MRESLCSVYQRTGILSSLALMERWELAFLFLDCGILLESQLRTQHQTRVELIKRKSSVRISLSHSFSTLISFQKLYSFIKSVIDTSVDFLFTFFTNKIADYFINCFSVTYPQFIGTGDHSDQPLIREGNKNSFYKGDN